MRRKAGGEGVATHQTRRLFKWIVLVTDTQSIRSSFAGNKYNLTSRPLYAPGLFFVCVGGENSTALFPTHAHTKEKKGSLKTMKQVLVFTYYIQLICINIDPLVKDLWYKSKLTTMDHCAMLVTMTFSH